MNCTEYLFVLETATADELGSPGARAHSTTCRDCNRLTHIVLEREDRVRSAYEQLDAYLPPGHVAAHALATARRHRIVRNLQAAVIAAMAMATVLLVTRRSSSTPVRVVRETVRLQCLSPEQAVEVIREARGTTASVSIPPGPLAIVRIEAPSEQMAELHVLLDRFDSRSVATCAARVVVPKG